MPRSIWKGALSFGLVNIPVRIVSAVSDKEIRFHWIHAPDGSRIHVRRVCAKEGKEVPMEDIVKGFELGPGKHVVFTPEELKALESETTHTIDILDFVELKEIDPLYFEHPYYMVPEKRSEKAYGLILESMRKKNRVAIARVVMRGKESLVAIRAQHDVLMMQTMRYAEEVIPPESAIGETKISIKGLPAREISMAERLVETLTGPFDPSKYENEYRQRVLRAVEKKAEGEEIVAQPEEKPPTRSQDLLEALEKSVAEAKRRMHVEA